MFELTRDELRGPIQELINLVWQAHQDNCPHVQDNGLIELVKNRYGEDKAQEVASRFPINLQKNDEKGGQIRSEGPFFKLDTSQFTILFTSPLQGKYESSEKKLSLFFDKETSVVVEKDFFGIPFSVEVIKIDFEKTFLYVDVGNETYNLKVTWSQRP